jgi:hypothetical protein
MRGTVVINAMAPHVETGHLLWALSKWAGEPLTAGPHYLSNIEDFLKPTQTADFKNRKKIFRDSKNLEKFCTDRVDRWEQLSLLVKLQK